MNKTYEVKKSEKEKKGSRGEIGKNIELNKEVGKYCGLCFDQIEEGRFVSCIDCQKEYHLECAGFNRIQYKDNKKPLWFCSLECDQRNNCENLPINLGKQVSKEGKKEVSYEIENLKLQIASLMKFQENLASKYAELVQINTNLSEQLETIKDSIRKNNTCEDEKSISNLKEKKSENLETIENIEADLNSLKQYHLRKNIVIKGVKLLESEPAEIFKKILEFLKCDIYINEDIKSVFVLKETEEKNFFKIIVKFYSLQIKNYFLRCRKGVKITPQDINEKGMKNIIIEDQLTKENIKLLKEAKNLTKFGVKFVWILRGRICYKIKENTQYHIIYSFKHLQSIERGIIQEIKQASSTYN